MAESLTVRMSYDSLDNTLPSKYIVYYESTEHGEAHGRRRGFD
jgi:hypothetical protein